MPDLQLVPCTEHGPSQFCHVNKDGKHADPALCCCRPGGVSIFCAIDAHNPLLSIGEDLVLAKPIAKVHGGLLF